MKKIRALLAVSLALAHVASARDLQGVYEDALQSDPQIREARANRLASREARPQAWAALLPQLSATASREQDKQDGTQATLTFDPASGAYIPIAEGFNQ